MKKFLLLVVPLAVAGCALTPGHGSLDPAQSVYALEGAYAAALQGAVAFYLPAMLLSGFLYPFETLPRWAGWWSISRDALIVQLSLWLIQWRRCKYGARPSGRRPAAVVRFDGAVPAGRRGRSSGCRTAKPRNCLKY